MNKFKFFFKKLTEFKKKKTKKQLGYQTYCTASGDPVREMLLSGRPTLSANKQHKMSVTFKTYHIGGAK